MGSLIASLFERFIKTVSGIFIVILQSLSRSFSLSYNTLLGICDEATTGKVTRDAEIAVPPTLILFCAYSMRPPSLMNLPLLGFGENLGELELVMSKLNLKR